MVTRILPPEEWFKLEHTGSRIPWRDLNPERNTVLVTETPEGIMGTLVLMHTLHAEFFWTHPAHRGKSGVFRSLWRQMVCVAREWGARTVLGAALEEPMMRIMHSLGTMLPGEHFVMSIEEMDRCRQQ